MLSTARLLSGATFLVVALGFSAALAVARLTSVGLPGCGPQSACAELASGPWGSLPLVDWPVSFLGTAWFAGVLAAWFLSRPGLSPELRAAVRLGAFGSALFLSAMVMERELCGYCLGVHAGNLGFAAIAWRAPASTTSRARVRVAGVGLWLLVTVSLIGARARVTGDQELLSEEALRRTIAEVLEREEEREVQGQDPVDAGSADDRRHRRGPPTARVRLRAFMDYECRGCHLVLEEIEALRQEYGDIEVCVQHFPMCGLCNSYVGRSMLHPNACWAALAAEAASILRGEEGFWQMHDWLFERRGKFEDTELRAVLAEFDYPPDVFEALMRSHEAVRRVRSDTDAATRLGAERIPFVFLNGVEVENVLTEGQLRRVVEAVLRGG